MSPSPSLAPRSGGRSLSRLYIANPTTAWPPDNGSSRASHHLAETGNSLWPAHVRILSEYKHASCLKPASDCLQRPHCAKKHASVPLLQCWPKSCTGSPRQDAGVSNKVGVAFGYRTINRGCGCRTRGRLSGRRWENRRHSCLPSVMPPESCFQKMAGVSSLARGSPSVASDVGGIRRQTTMSTSI